MDVYDWEVKNPELALLKKIVKNLDSINEKINQIDKRMMKLESFIFNLIDKYKDLDKTLFI